MKTEEQKRLEALQRAKENKEYWLKVKSGEYSFITDALSTKNLNFIRSHQSWTSEEKVKLIDRKIKHHEDQIQKLS